MIQRKTKKTVRTPKRRGDKKIKPRAKAVRAVAGRSFSFEFQGRCSAFTSWRACERYPKTFSLAAHNEELVLRHMTFVLKQLFQISLE
jgi:hypothetical protein